MVDSYLSISVEDLARYGIPKGNAVIGDKVSEVKDKLEALLKDYEFTTPEAGGSAVNTAKALSVLSDGKGVAVLGQYSDDLEGRIIADNLDEFKVTNYSVVKKGDRTSRLYICVTPDAQRTVIGNFYDSYYLDSREADFSKINDFDYVLVEAYSFSRELHQDAIYKTLENIEKYEKKMVFALSNSFCVDFFKEEMLRFCNHYCCKIIIGNKGEFMSLFDGFKDSDEMIDYLISQNKWEAFIVTDSDKGAWIVKGQEKLFVKAPKVDSIVDTTGAGDYFAAGFLNGFLNGKDLNVCARIANILAGDIISRIGVRLSSKAIAEAKSCI